MPNPVPNSISVIEQFYGDRLGPDLLRKIRTTPYDQLLVLAGYLVQYNRSVEHAFNLRAFEGSYSRDKFDLRFDTFRTGELFLWEDLYCRENKLRALTEETCFKHAVLYSERFVLPDGSLDWAEDLLEIEEEMPEYADEQDAGRRLAAAVRGLIAIGPLVAQGIIVLAASSANLDISVPWDDRYNLAGRCDLQSLHSGVYSGDPYLAWLMLKSVLKVEEWELEARGLSGPYLREEAAEVFMHDAANTYTEEQGLMERVRRSYDPRLQLTDLQDAVILNHMYRRAAFIPIAASDLSRTHLSRSAKVQLDGLTAIDVQQHNALRAAARCGIPAVANVSLDDVIRLRLQEEVYEDVRSSLRALMMTVADVGPPGSFRECETIVKNAAEEIIRPVYERLNSRRRREKLAGVIVGYAVGGAVTLAVNAAATLLSGPAALAVHHAANTAGNVGKKRAARRISGASHEREIACSLLLTVMDDE
jgi:hypothetical protein